MAVNSIDAEKVAEVDAQSSSTSNAQQGNTSAQFSSTSDSASSQTTASGRTGDEAVAAAYRVVQGAYGAGSYRATALTNEGYDADQVQQYVNTIMYGGTPDPTTYKGAAAEEPAVDNNIPTEQDVSNAQSIVDKIAAGTDARKKYRQSYADIINQQWDEHDKGIQQSIDFNTQQAQREAAYTYEDAVRDFQKKYRASTASMYTGMDNAALTARAAGQNGGTATQSVSAAQSQYQKARQELALEQQKLATDTMREIESLRADGEFEKASKLLQARQQRLQEIYSELIRVDENEYSDYVQQTTWSRDDAEIQRNQEQADKEWRQKLGMQAMSYGLMPTDEMLAAMGIDSATAQLYINAVKAGY